MASKNLLAMQAVCRARRGGQPTTSGSLRRRRSNVLLAHGVVDWPLMAGGCEQRAF